MSNPPCYEIRSLDIVAALHLNVPYSCYAIVPVLFPQCKPSTSILTTFAQDVYSSIKLCEFLNFIFSTFRYATIFGTVSAFLCNTYYAFITVWLSIAKLIRRASLLLYMLYGTCVGKYCMNVELVCFVHTCFASFFLCLFLYCVLVGHSRFCIFNFADCNRLQL